MSACLVQRDVWQPEHWPDQATHSERCVDSNGVGLTEHPGHQVLQTLVQLVIPLLHHVAEQAWHDIAGDGDHALPAKVVPPIMGLVVVAAPACDPLVCIALYALVACALLHAHEVLMALQPLNNVVWDVLACSAGDVVDDSGSLVKYSTEVCHQAIQRGFAIVGVDLQRGVHPHCKALRCGV